MGRAVQAVAGAELQLIHAGEHVELGERHGGQPVHPRGHPQRRQIEPAAAPRPAGGRAELGAGLAQLLADRALELGGKGTAADPGRVGLGDAQHPVDAGRPDARAGAGAAGDGVRAGHEGIGAVVDVEHRPLGALEQDLLAGGERVGGFARGVAADGLQPLGPAGGQLEDLLGARQLAAEGLRDGRPVGQVRLDLRFETVAPEVADPHAAAADLVLVGGADAALGGADLAVAGRRLTEPVQQLVVGQDQVRALGDAEAPRGAHAARFEGVDLVDDGLGVDDRALADQAALPFVENAARHQVEDELLAADHQRVAGVRATGVAHHELGVWREQVDDLPLALISPLRSDNDQGRHSHSPLTNASVASSSVAPSWALPSSRSKRPLPTAPS